MAGDYCLCADPKASLFIESIFRECRVGATDISILTLQYISTIIWLFALLPQVRLSYLAKISDVSIVFSIIWTFADILSLLSMFLTGVMISQKVMQIYFVLVDVILFLQVLYYKKHQNIPKLSLELRSWEISTYTLIVVCVIVGIAMFYWQNKEVIEMIMDLQGPITENQNCNEQGSVANKKVLLAGQIIGYISIPFFPLSRITQIIATVKSKHVEGISPLMFCLTISVIDAIEYNRFVEQVPFMCNAILPALLDFVIIFQYIKYSKLSKANKEEQKTSGETEEQVVKRPRQQSVRERVMQSIDLEDYPELIGNNKATQTGDDDNNEQNQQPAQPTLMNELQTAVEQSVSIERTATAQIQNDYMQKNQKLIRDEQIIAFNQVIQALLLQKRQLGKPTTEEIIEIIPQLCRSLNIHKDMALEQIQFIIDNIQQIEDQVISAYQNNVQYQQETLQYESKEAKNTSVFEQQEYSKIKQQYFNQNMSDSFQQLIQYTKTGCTKQELQNLRIQLLMDARYIYLQHNGKLTYGDLDETQDQIV